MEQNNEIVSVEKRFFAYIPTFIMHFSFLNNEKVFKHSSLIIILFYDCVPLINDFYNFDSIYY